MANKQNLCRHYNTCKVKNKKDQEENLKKNTEERIQEIIIKYEKQIEEQKYKYEKQIEEQKTNYEKKIQDLVHFYEIKIVKLENTIEINDKLCDEYRQQIGIQTEVNKEITIKAIENAGPKTTNTINNRNQIYNALEPLTDEHMKDQAQHLTYQNITNGAHGIAHFASNYTFKGRVFCSDKSRLNFVFKNENGVIIKDPEGVEITNKFIEINREELLRLLDLYFIAIIKELDKDLDIIEYKHWSKRREEIIATKSAIKKGNVQENKEYYTEFKNSFLSALSDLVPR